MAKILSEERSVFVGNADKVFKSENSINVTPYLGKKDDWDLKYLREFLLSQSDSCALFYSFFKDGSLAKLFEEFSKQYNQDAATTLSPSLHV